MAYIAVLFLLRLVVLRARFHDFSASSYHSCMNSAKKNDSVCSHFFAHASPRPCCDAGSRLLIEPGGTKLNWKCVPVFFPSACKVSDFTIDNDNADDLAEQQQNKEADKLLKGLEDAGGCLLQAAMFIKQCLFGWAMVWFSCMQFFTDQAPRLVTLLAISLTNLTFFGRPAFILAC